MDRNMTDRDVVLWGRMVRATKGKPGPQWLRVIRRWWRWWCAKLPYVVTLVADDTVIATHYSHHTMGKTMRLAYGLVAGMPQVECCVRRHGKLKAVLETNHRGRVDTIEVYSPDGPQVALMNPDWRGFQAGE